MLPSRRALYFWGLLCALVLAGLLLSVRLWGQEPDSPMTTSGSIAPSLTPLEALLQADLTLAVLELKAQTQQQLVLQQSDDLQTLNIQILSLRASSVMLDQQLTDSSAALVASGLAQGRLQTSLDKLTISFGKLSVDLAAAREAGDALRRDSAAALIAEQAKLLPWQIVGVGGGVVGLGAIAYLTGHALGWW